MERNIMEGFQIPKVENDYERGFEAGYAKGILDNRDYFSGMKAGEKITAQGIICFLKDKNNGKKFSQDLGLGLCINQLCDKYGFSGMKYSNEELDDMI